jgi:RHH-type proline utilization regulon transcriptional repressor/proline dehydrogenase/delta 1-pyrroline-5-carboxylate dehydrogenase
MRIGAFRNPPARTAEWEEALCLSSTLTVNAIRPMSASPSPKSSPRYRLAIARDPLRAAIAEAARRPEEDVVAEILPGAAFAREARERIRVRAVALARHVRAARAQSAGADALMQAFALSSDEGIALMCLAEALLRIPDATTADALIRDKIGRGDWQAHLGSSDSLFVNAACWGLLVTGKLVAAPPPVPRLARALHGALDRIGEPVIRAAMRAAMRFLGEQFVLGETIEAALARARPREAQGYCYSYDMLGEAALGAADAQRYRQAYAEAIVAIGRAAHGRAADARAGVSIKLSALHPRFARSQRERVLQELLPAVLELAVLAKQNDIALTIDAEEADRLELSLDVIEALATDPALEGFDGLGAVVQAYLKHAPRVVAWLAALARRSGRRLPVRLVKGAYWDAEIKRAQVDGMADYPVLTRKAHSDVAYLACARTLLASRDVIYPQFATHNAATLAAIVELAGEQRGYEFQCLHGMGEVLFDAVVGDPAIGVPCRIYAPVGTHETLLAYLVRRLLENGANTSFVNQVVDPAIDLEKLVADPVDIAAPFKGSRHPRIPPPGMLFPDRRNSRGIDLADEGALRTLERALIAAAERTHEAAPMLAHDKPLQDNDARVPVRSPADTREIVGHVRCATPAEIASALDDAATAGRDWSATPAVRRAEILERAADLLEERAPAFIDLAVREAGRTIGNAIGEVREAADFCRYYARCIRDDAPAPALGPVVCISPWNFPLAIFTGQVAGALAAGNPVLAKPAEQTPLVAAEAVRTLREAGVPPAALQLLPGPGETVGAALVADARVQGVAFTGSTAVAVAIHRTLAARGNVPMIAETGGQNAMIVDSSALLEQVVVDAIVSAFDSAGQRCSALRVLFLQDDIADRAIAMLADAMAELRLGDPGLLATDVGPIIDLEAKRALETHAARMEREAKRIAQVALPPELASGHYFAPVAYEIPSLALPEREVFGPILHVVRFRAVDLDRTVDAINATGYALTLGIHSRIDATVARIVARSRAGNVYVNRNMVGAVVGVQPFGGEGLSGTGPKAGGPLYVRRLTRDTGAVDGSERVLPGPTGEDNRWRLAPRGLVVALGGPSPEDWREPARAALAAGNRVRFAPGADRAAALAVAAEFRRDGADIAVLDEGVDWATLPALAAVIAHDAEAAAEANRRVAAREGARIAVIEPVGNPPRYPQHRLSVERTLTINATAAGGNASLVAAMD